MARENVICRVKDGLITALIASLLLSVSGCGVLVPKYTTEIERVAANDFEHSLIAAAEAACADEESLAATCTQGTDATETCGWSCGATRYFKITYAVTGDAVNYYRGLMERYGDFGVPPWEKPIYASLRYSATVNFYSRYSTIDGETYGDVHVVYLELSFSTTCGTLCSYSMGAVREVIFDADGNLIDIKGDRQLLVEEM